MPSWTLMSILAILAATPCLVYWLVALARVRRLARSFTTTSMAPTGDDSAAPGRVRVVVPAHNEQGHIAGLIRSLRAQVGVEELCVTLCLDRCTDGTEQVAREAIGDDDRFEIITIDACPEGWAGKVHAVWSGVERSTHEDPDWWVFTDADTEMHPDLLRTVTALASERGDGLVSLLSTLRVERWFERWVQPMSGIELGRQFPTEKASEPDPAHRRAFANGQFMCFDARTYEAAGGHEGVKDTLLEDMALAERVKGLGVGAAVYTANGMHRCAMYDSWDEYTRGWARIYTECAKRKPARLRRHAWHTRVANTALPGLALVSIGLGTVGSVVGGSGIALDAMLFGIGALFMHLVTLSLAFRIAGAPLSGVWLGWLCAWINGGILLRAARDLEQGNPTEWGGKAYHREKR